MYTEKMILTKSLMDTLCDAVQSEPAITGGILSSKDGGKTIDCVDLFDGDEEASTILMPDAETVKSMRLVWDLCELEMVGFVRSGSPDDYIPSREDHEYAMSVMEAMDGCDSFYMLALHAENPPDGTVRFYPHLFTKTPFGLCSQPLGLEVDDER